MPLLILQLLNAVIMCMNQSYAVSTETACPSTTTTVSSSAYTVSTETACPCATTTVSSSPCTISSDINITIMSTSDKPLFKERKQSINL